MQAMLLVLNDQSPKDIDAVFMHGSSVKSATLDRMQIELGYNIHRSTEAQYLVINGTPTAECGKIAYAGAENWLEVLNELRVPKEYIIQTPVAKHSAAECKHVLQLASQFKWKKIAVVALPHHAIRIMRTWAAEIARNGSDLKVYIQIPRGVNWRMPAAKPVLDKDGGEIKGTFFDHIQREFEQGERFENKAGEDELGKFTPHATLEELLAYYAQRDGVAEEVDAEDADIEVEDVPDTAPAAKEESVAQTT